MARLKIKIGDWITFKAATRFTYRKARRKVVGFDSLGRPEVGYQGWSNFVVRPDEVISVESC